MAWQNLGIFCSSPVNLAVHSTASSCTATSVRLSRASRHLRRQSKPSDCLTPNQAPVTRSLSTRVVCQGFSEPRFFEVRTSRSWLRKVMHRRLSASMVSFECRTGSKESAGNGVEALRRDRFRGSAGVDMSSLERRLRMLNTQIGDP